jgi:hypothetical protein
MNIKEFKIPKILFIKSVFIKDCIEIDDIFEQQILESIKTPVKIINFVKLPGTFTNLSTWITKTNIKCWYCDLNFDNIPIFIPKLIEPNLSGYSIKTYGCFCSFSCAVTFNNIYNKKVCDNIHIRGMLYFLYKLFNNKNAKEIYESYSKYNMIHYGGKMSTHQYVDNNKKINDKMLSESY